MQLFKETFKPVLRYFNDPAFREYLRVKKKCRRTKSGDPVTLKISGFSIETNNASSFLHLYEEIVVGGAFDIDLKNNSPVIICAGANIGIELFLLSKKYPSGRIIAYEADAHYAALLRKNIARNKISNVELNEAAVWTFNGKIPFESDGGLGGKAGNAGKDVVAVDFLAELKKHQSIDLLLMDVEGAEFNIFQHCKNELYRIRNLFVEWHGREKEPQQLPEFLTMISSSGFRYRLDNKLPVSPFKNRLVENGFDAMTGIYAHRPE
ncbi:MAG TPA: FkbM family methyltransferase [Bacteroidia bacterium]|jgi:FkbM family methyltransferase|nr:FkbM family methyltransferase [Bacteroidia bacterium]